MNHNLTDVKRITLITKVKQRRMTNQNKFNNIGSIMIAGCEEYIYIWNLIGKSKQLRRLAGSSGYALCIVVSKIKLWIACGSQFGVISSWNEKGFIYISQQKHIEEVTHILLEKKEEELISCSNDVTIKVWKVDCQSNQIQYQYDLINQHVGPLYQISMNESEQYLVSCSYDQTIILWHKINNNNRWQFLNKYQAQKVIFQIQFINDSVCVFQTYPNITIEILEIQNGKLLYKPEQQLIMNQDLLENEEQFPIIYNKKKEIIIQIYNGNIYFMKKLINCLKLIFSPICCPIHDVCGTITLNGEILVVWNDDLELYRIYKIQ